MDFLSSQDLQDIWMMQLPVEYINVIGKGLYKIINGTWNSFLKHEHKWF